MPTTLTTKYIVKRATLTFGGASYLIKNTLPVPEEICEAVDVTTLDDAAVRRLPGALMDKGELTVRIQGQLPIAAGVPAALKPGTQGALGMMLTIAGGVSEATVTVAAGDWIIQNCKSVEIEANNTRELAWETQFVCAGTDTAAATE